MRYNENKVIIPKHSQKTNKFTYSTNKNTKYLPAASMLKDKYKK